MARTVLLDTGFLVALVNRRDRDHERCATTWRTLRARVVTVEGVLVEAAHLLRRSPGGAAHALRLVIDARTLLAAPSADRFERAITLMANYHDTPMDLVDALLVAIAEEASISEVLTLDRRGFETYRLQGRRRFNILPR